MDKQKIAKELVKLARDLIAADTFKCPECGTKVLEQTGYCVKCKKKVKKAGNMAEFTIHSDRVGIEEERVYMTIHGRQVIVEATTPLNRINNGVYSKCFDACEKIIKRAGR